ncbi:MAG: hypothetical protein Q8O76_14755, partial [Chloroflexota bacterium]|nr:hypothetical protein [Chloroflexota bacterium]
YGQTGATGPQVATIGVLKNGTITKAFIDQLTIDASWAQFNDVVRVASGIYAVSSRSGPSVNIGKITTFDVVEGPSVPGGMRGLNPAFMEVMGH